MEKWRNHYFAAQDIGFYFASSDRELIDKVSSIMKRNGHISFSDSMGREHYLLDGRSGVPTLTRNIDSVTKRIVRNNKEKYEQLRPYFSRAIEETLFESGIPKQLKGYRYIKFILHRIIEDDSLLSPISKTIYPGICELYKCTTFQIERDIRYAIRKTVSKIDKASPKSYICNLLEYATNIASNLESCELSSNNQIDNVNNISDYTGHYNDSQKNYIAGEIDVNSINNINNINNEANFRKSMEKSVVVHRKTYPMNIDYDRFSYLNQE